MKPKKAITLLLLAFLVLAQYGCLAFGVGAAAGGTGAYIMRDQGYQVQSPVKK